MKKLASLAFWSWLGFLFLLLVAPQRRQEPSHSVRPLTPDEVEVLIENELDEREYNRRIRRLLDRQIQ